MNWTSLSIPKIGTLLILMGVTLFVALSGAEKIAFAIALSIALLVVVTLRPNLAILALLITFLFSYSSYLPDTGRLTPNNVLGAVLCILLAVKLLKGEFPWLLRIRQIPILAAIGLIFLIATYMAPAHPESLASIDRTNKELWDFFSQAAFVTFMIFFIVNAKQASHVFWILYIVILFSAVSSITNLMQPAADYRAVATFGVNMAKNSNHLAFYCLMGTVMSWYLLQTARSISARLCFMVMGLLFLGVIFLTASRNAMINVLVLFTVITFESGLSKRKVLATAAVFVLIGSAALHFVPEKNLERIAVFNIDPTQKEASQSLLERYRTLLIGWKIFLYENPLIGVGPGNFRWIRRIDYDHKTVPTHNAFLWALTSGGVVALLLYLLLFWVTWKDLRWMEHRGHATGLPPPWMIQTVRTTFILFMVFSLFTEAWLELILFLLVGLTATMKKIHLQAAPSA